jgi:hypothetical protein
MRVVRRDTDRRTQTRRQRALGLAAQVAGLRVNGGRYGCQPCRHNSRAPRSLGWMQTACTGVASRPSAGTGRARRLGSRALWRQGIAPGGGAPAEPTSTFKHHREKGPSDCPLRAMALSAGLIKPLEIWLIRDS